MPPDDDHAEPNAIIPRLAAAMARLDPGALAQLRRMDPHGPGEGAFWALQASLGFPGTTLWLEQVRRMALLAPRGDPARGKMLHNKDRRFGRALGETGYPEARLLRFMALPVERRAEPLERMVRWLAAKDQERGVNCVDLFWLRASLDVRATRQLAAAYYSVRFADDAKPDAKKEPA